MKLAVKLKMYRLAGAVVTLLAVLEATGAARKFK